MTAVTEIMQATFGALRRSKRPPMWLLSNVGRSAAAAAAIAIATGAAAGCTASSDEVEPDELRIFFPTGAVVSPDGMKLFVTNANSDLTYSSGSISVLPLPSIETVIGGWLARGTGPGDTPVGFCEGAAPNPCCRDDEFAETLVCDEELFLGETRDAGVRIGNFATDVAIQDLGDGRLRLIVPTRGDPSIAWADWDPGQNRLLCDDERPDARFPSCDASHRLSFVLNDDERAPIPEEPFGVYASSADEFAMVTHLSTGKVTLIDSPRPREGAPPVQVTDIQDNIFSPDPGTGLRGASGIAGRTPNAPGGIVYVGSRSEDRIQTFTVGRPPNNAPPFLLLGSWFFLDGVGNSNTNTNASASDTRGMTFSPTGNRLYLLNRRPPTLQILDTSIGPTGVPRNVLTGAVDICRQASTITVADPGDGERAYLTCFQDGQIIVVDPRGHGRVEEFITVGSGPYSVAAAPDGRRLYVTNFLEDTVAVIDLTPGSPTRNRVVLRIGAPRRL